MARSVVALKRCSSYAPEAVDAALCSLLGELGGIERFIRPGARIFVKANLLLAAEPDRACTTHPEVLIATIKSLQRAGADVSFGDLPGGFHVGNTQKIHETTMMSRVAEATGARLVVLEKYGFKRIEIPDAKFIDHIHVPKYLDETDGVVSVSKLKTHMQTLLTGAVKNLFGLTTTQDRLRAHKLSRYSDFAEAVVDIFSALPPVLNIIDAVVGMEGTGPSQGTPVRLGFLVGSADAVAADTVAAVATGFHPREIGTIEAARRRGLGAARMGDIELRGDSPDSVKKKIRRPSTAVLLLMPVLAAPFTDLTKVRPVIEPVKCENCKKCAEVCPAQAIHFSEKSGKIDDGRCMMCFCCHEICPHGAVGLKKPIIVKIAEWMRA